MITDITSLKDMVRIPTERMCNAKGVGVVTFDKAAAKARMVLLAK